MTQTTNHSDGRSDPGPHRNGDKHGERVTRPSYPLPRTYGLYMLGSGLSSVIAIILFAALNDVVVGSYAGGPGVDDSIFHAPIIFLVGVLVSMQIYLGPWLLVQEIIGMTILPSFAGKDNSIAMIAAPSATLFLIFSSVLFLWVRRYWFVGKEWVATVAATGVLSALCFLTLNAVSS